MAGPLIGTHNGHFHADEALAVYLLRLLPTYASSPLVRTRDPSVLATCHTVVDVGGEYNPQTLRFDHHQREFNTVFPSHSTKLSSAGLVYMHFGKEIIAQQTGLNIASSDVDILYEKLYTDLIEAFDANDNGISAYAASDLAAAGITKRFDDRGFTIASVVNRYNHAPLLDSGPPTTTTTTTSSSSTSTASPKTKQQLQSDEDARFAKASAFTGEQFALALADAHAAWLPARALVHHAYHARLQYDPRGRIMVLPHRDGSGVPWADHLYALEAEAEAASNPANPANPAEPAEPVSPHVLFVLFPESADSAAAWRVRAVSTQRGGFENRRDLPDAWKGLRDAQLEEASGIPGCVFVHASGFIGGNRGFEGALGMARRALEL